MPRKLQATLCIQPPSAADRDALHAALGAAWQRARRAELDRAPTIHSPTALPEGAQLGNLESTCLAWLLDPDRGWHVAKRLSVSEIRELATRMAEKMRQPGGGGWQGALEVARNVSNVGARTDRASLTAGPHVLLTPGGEPVEAPSRDASLAAVVEWLREHAPIKGESYADLFDRARQTRSALASLAGISGPPPLLASAWPGRTKTERVIAAMRSRSGERFDIGHVRAASALAHSAAAI